MSKRVRACPVCGVSVLHTCYHDGRDIQSEDMDIHQALEVVKARLAHLEEQRLELINMQARYLVKLASEPVGWEDSQR